MENETALLLKFAEAIKNLSGMQSKLIEVVDELSKRVIKLEQFTGENI